MPNLQIFPNRNPRNQQRDELKLRARTLYAFKPQALGFDAVSRSGQSA